MNNKKILLITVRADIGGGPIHINELINNFNLTNIELYLACPFLGELYCEKWKENSRIKKIKEIPYRKFSVKSFFLLFNFIRLNKIDIIHSHGKGAGVYSRLLKVIIPNIKVIHTFHGIGNVRDRGFFKKIKNVYLEKILTKYTSIFISVSHGEKKLAILKFKVKDYKIRVIYNGVSDEPEINEKGILESIVTFSRFTYEKNMFDCYEIVKKTSPSIIFNWVGDGDDYKIIHDKIIHDNIVNLSLLGFHENPKKFLVPGSIYLSTSRHEGLPLALLEAESIGIPIVATNVIGNNEVVIDGYNGFLFDEGDINKAVEKIELLVNDKKLYNSMSKNARIDYLKRFTVKRMINATEKIYNEIVG